MMPFLFMSVASLFTSFLENKFDVIAEANAEALHFDTSLGFFRHPTCSFLILVSSPRSQQVSPATQQMQPTQTIQPPQPAGGRRRRVVDEDPDERRRKFLERNRAAATRCRQKRKVWVMSLEKKAEELTQTNMQLQVQAAVSLSGLKGPVYSWHFLSQQALVDLSSHTTR